MPRNTFGFTLVLSVTAIVPGWHRHTSTAGSVCCVVGRISIYLKLTAYLFLDDLDFLFSITSSHEFFYSSGTVYSIRFPDCEQVPYWIPQWGTEQLIYLWHFKPCLKVWCKNFRSNFINDAHIISPTQSKNHFSNQFIFVTVFSHQLKLVSTVDSFQTQTISRHGFAQNRTFMFQFKTVYSLSTDTRSHVHT